MLSQFRQEIDKIDSEILALFEKRMDIARQVGAYKKEHNLPIFDSEREETILKNRIRALNNPDYRNITISFFSHLMHLSRQVQEKD